MNISYRNDTMAPNVVPDEHQLQLELKRGRQWKKGFSTLVLTFTAGDLKSAQAAVKSYFRDNKLEMRCPRDRKLSRAVQDAAQSLLFGRGIRTIITDELQQTRIDHVDYKLTWFSEEITSTDIVDTCSE